MWCACVCLVNWIIKCIKPLPKSIFTFSLASLLREDNPIYNNFPFFLELISLPALFCDVHRDTSSTLVSTTKINWHYIYSAGHLTKAFSLMATFQNILAVVIMFYWHLLIFWLRFLFPDWLFYCGVALLTYGVLVVLSSKWQLGSPLGASNTKRSLFHSHSFYDMLRLCCY